MGNLSNSVIKGERLYSKIGNIITLISVIVIGLVVIRTFFESDEQIKKESKDDKGGLAVKKYSIPILIVLALVAYASISWNKLVQKNNNVALVKGGYNIGSIIGNVLTG